MPHLTVEYSANLEGRTDLDALCARAVAKGVFGTKMRSVVNLANPAGVKAIAPISGALWGKP